MELQRAAVRAQFSRRFEHFARRASLTIGTALELDQQLDESRISQELLSIAGSFGEEVVNFIVQANDFVEHKDREPKNLVEVVKVRCWLLVSACC